MRIMSEGGMRGLGSYGADNFFDVFLPIFNPDGAMTYPLFNPVVVISSESEKSYVSDIIANA